MAPRAKAASAAPTVQVTNDFSASPYTFNGPLRPIWCAKHHFTGPWPCKCVPGPQIALLNPLVVQPRGSKPWLPDIIATGGARGGSKTFSLLALAGFRGNPLEVQKAILAGRQPRPVDLSYYTHKNYRGLILRPQTTDLDDVLDRAEAMYGPTGAVITRGSPPMVSWPKTGAKISFGHFLDDGWKKYVGPEYQFIGIDQIEMMAEEKTMHLIAGSCRSKWPELRPLVMGTFNPGGGDDNKGAPGQNWLMEYFRIHAYLDGRVPHYGAVRDEHGKVRMFVPSKVQDNPYFLYSEPQTNADKTAIICFTCSGEIPVPMPERPDDQTNVCPLCKGKLLNDGSYLKWLNGIEPESLRKAWRDGDMLALSGAYFGTFRPNGPLTGEPENASHVFDPEKQVMEDWWHTWGSIDWGYIHPTDLQFHKKSPWGQIFTYKEISFKRTEPFELGVAIARECKPILQGFRDHGMPAHLNFYLSPDAYAKKQSENTVASQIAAGIKQELGRGSAFLVEFTETEKELKAAGKAEQAFEAMMRRRSEQKETLITLVPASTDRVAGWMHMQSLMRFKPLQETSIPDKEFADRLYQEKGLIAYKEYMNLPEFAAANEVLPKWKVSKDCKELIRAIPKAMHKAGGNDIEKFDASENTAGDDPLDSVRYGLFSEKQQGDSFPPLEQRIDKRVNDLAANLPGLSTHSVTMMREHARYQETVGKNKPNSIGGHNRFAARRAMFQQQIDSMGGRPN